MSVVRKDMRIDCCPPEPSRRHLRLPVTAAAKTRRFGALSVPAALHTGFLERKQLRYFDVWAFSMRY